MTYRARTCAMLVTVLLLPAGALAQKVEGPAKRLQPPEQAAQPPGLAEQGVAEAVSWSDTLTLEEAIGIALRENPSLKSGAERVEQARQRVRQARSAYFPLLAVSGSATKTRLDASSYRNQQQIFYLVQSQQPDPIDEFIESGLPGLPDLGIPSEYLRILAETFYNDPTFDRTFTDYALSFSARWQAFDGFARYFTYKATKMGEEEARLLHRDGQRMLIQAVAQTYYAAQLAREDISIARADEEFNLRQLKESKAKVEAGAAAYSEELNFQVRANQSRTLLIEALSSYRVGLAALAELLDLADTSFVDDVELAPLQEATAEELQAPELTPFIHYALAHRPDLGQNEFAVRRTAASTNAWRGQWYPTVGLSATHAATLRDDINFNGEDFGTALRMDITYNIFSGGKRVARIAEAKAAEREAQYDLYATENSVTTEVRRAYERLLAAQENLELQRKNAAIALENRELVEKAFNVGQVSLVRLNEAQRDQLAAQGQLALSRVGLRQGWHDLRTATAETLAGVPAGAD